MLVVALLLQAAVPPAALPRRFVACNSGVERRDPVAAPSACRDMKASRVYEGVWYDVFEGQQFFENAHRLPTNPMTKAGVWLDINRVSALELARLPSRIAELRTPRAYRIRFVGAEKRDMACASHDSRGLPTCYGSQGMFPGLVVVDRLESIEPL